MSEEALISILLPFKNEGQYIEQCLASILNQDYSNWELIAVDDHSSDLGTQLVVDCASKDNRVKYFKNPGVGVISALSHAFQNSNGLYITRMDADDYKSSNNLSSLYKNAGRGRIAVGLVKYFRNDGLGDGYRFYENWINETNITGNTWKEVYKECVIPSPCWLVHREDFIRSGGFNSELYPEDYDLCFRFYKAGLLPICNDSIIHYWRDHEIRTTRVSNHYSDNHFAHLKVHYFIEIDWNAHSNLVLIGAGKKAKKIAQLFIDKGIVFRWFTNNANKTGHNIYGVILEDLDNLQQFDNQQIIVAIANTSLSELKPTFKDSGNVFHFY